MIRLRTLCSALIIVLASTSPVGVPGHTVELQIAHASSGPDTVCAVHYIGTRVFIEELWREMEIMLAGNAPSSLANSC